MKKSYIYGLLFFLLLASLELTAQNKIKVACIGNSITFGSGVEEGKKYPDVLQNLLGNNYEVKNFGLSGRTLLKKGDRPYWNEEAYQTALQWQPDIVVIKLGTNDSKPQNWEYKDDFISDYVELVKSFKNLPSRPKVFISYPIPVFEDKWGIREAIVKDEIIPAINVISKKTRVKIIDLYTHFAGKKELVFDGVHPNADGAFEMAHIIHQSIKKVKIKRISKA